MKSVTQEDADRLISALDFDPDSPLAWRVDRWFATLPATPPPSGDVEAAREALLEAAQRAVDNWNKVGAMGDDFRALRAAIELSKSSSSSPAAIRAEYEAKLAALRLLRAARLADDAGGWAGPWPDDEQEDTGAEA